MELETIHTGRYGRPGEFPPYMDAGGGLLVNPPNRVSLFWGLGAAGGLILLPLTLPVALGVLGAWALDSTILSLQRRTGMGREASAVLCVSGALTALGAGVWTLGRLLLRELMELSGQLPRLLERIASFGRTLSSMLERLSTGLPDGIGDALTAWAQGIVSGSGTLAQSVYQRIFTLVTNLLSSLPGGLFFLITLVLAWYFAAAELPRLRELGRMHLPRRFLEHLTRVAASLRRTLGGWARAQALLMVTTFLLLSAGFALLGMESPLLRGLAVAALDALPVLGTGTVLLPWALWCLLAGEMSLGLGLAGLYGAAALLRNILEPRLLGAQLGVSPLLTLAAIYGGWRAGGFWGMVLLPMGTLAAVQLWRGTRELSENPVTADAGRPDPEQGNRWGEGKPENRNMK